MRITLIVVVVVLALSLFSDIWIWQALRKRFKSHIPARVHLIIAISLYLMAGVALMLPRASGSDGVLLAVMWMLFIFMTCLIGKVIFSVFDIVASIPAMFRHKRLKWLSYTGIGIASAVVIILLWGCFINRFRLQTRNVTIEVANLPKAFDGFRIVQISDMHLGTFGNDTTFVKKLVDEVNSLKPDAVMFTGDIVNRRSEEMAPFVTTLAELKAPRGVYAILGNHDYGDYSSWPGPAAKEENMRRLYRFYDRTGWRLLRNETTWIVNGSDSLAIIGVENIGDPPFPIYGNLGQAYKRPLSDNHTKILLTHNPAHWVTDISDSDKNIALTLSGHTHAMQIELLGLSPAALRYPTWGGLYLDSNGRHPLYVNIGDGTVGFPARIGANPEITVITLKSKH